VPLWALFVGVHVWQAAHAHPLWPPLVTSSNHDGSAYPVVRALRPGTPLAGVAPGDRLLRAGELDLRGVGPVGVGVRLLEQSRTGRVRVTIERAGVEREVELALPAAGYPWWRGLVLGLGFLVPGLLLILRAPGATSRSFVLGSICYTLAWTPVYGGSHELTHLGLAVFAVASLLVGPCVVLAAKDFPPEVALRGRWHAVWPWAYALGGLFRIATLLGTPVDYELAARGLALYQIAAVSALVVLFSRAYRVSSPLGRRQIKWVVYSVYVGAAPYLVLNAIDALFPGRLDLRELAVLCAIALPVGLVIAIVRSQLFDIDRLISATASYSATIVALFGLALLLVNRVAHALSALLGADPSSMQTALSFVLALAVVPAQRTLRPHIEAFFFGERRALEEGVESLLRALSSCEGPQTLLERLGEWLDRLLRPENCVIYARDGDAYVPVFVQARAAPPAFGADGALARWLRARTGAAELDGGGRRARVALDAAERAALATLGTVVVLPIQRGGELAAFVCLGGKRSGDVYTPTDLSLLTAVADKTSTELQRFGEAEVLRQGREMQDALRRYVPGAIAEQLASGRDLTPREREVSVLFVDIRGYTALSQERRAEDIFSTVNRYTETVSRLVREHGGSVVEFNGDGMMAVFGAPEELPGKERAAVRAGRAIVAAVAEITPEGGVKPASAGGLSVGVGIATGPAFVGNIRAVDRLIWSAIGNTTNLAARLQSLTRELDAAIVIDGATAREAGDALDGFAARVAVPVRGRSEPIDLFVQPLVRVGTAG
jgi:class 3 adenylate cyclase